MSQSTMAYRIALAAALLAFAVEERPSEAANLCRGDALRFCMAEIPDRERIAACLQRRKADLSPGCRTMFDPPSSPAGHTADVH